MSELWKYFKPENWQNFQQNVVKVELKKKWSFYCDIKEFSPFENDITEALAALGSNMFENDLNNFRNWLVRKIPALDGKSPVEISTKHHGMNWMREFILRS